MYFLVPLVTAFEDVGERGEEVDSVRPLDGDTVWSRESESKFLTLVVNESRLGRGGSGDEAGTYLLLLAGMLMIVVLPKARLGGEESLACDVDDTVMTGLLETGMDEEEVRDFPSMDELRRL